MGKPNQPERWEAAIIAAAMAVAGTLFMFDKLGSLVRSGVLSWQATVHPAPMLLVVVGMSLLLLDQAPIPPVNGRSRGGVHE
jgi:hypothetical protein